MGINFYFLRLLAASMVVISHSFPFLGKKEPFNAMAGFGSFGQIAIYIFFVISGYLITGSFLNSKSIVHYLMKRVLRIYPAFICSVLFCLLIIGPLTTTLSLSDYFTSADTKRFLLNVNMFFLHYDLPGVFQNNVQRYVNGAWWTLPMEFTLYLAVILVANMKMLKIKPLLCFVIILFIVYLFTPKNSANFFFLPLYDFARNAALFFSGAFLYSCKDEDIWDKRLAIIAFLGIAFGVYLQQDGHMLLLLCLPYLTIYLARLPLFKRNPFERVGDLSYGIYLYAVPIQQLLIHLFKNIMSVGLLSGLALIGSSGLAFISWRYIEAPCLKLKMIRIPKVSI